MNAAFLSSLATWHQLEARTDCWASIGALAFAGIACLLVFMLT